MDREEEGTAPSPSAAGLVLTSADREKANAYLDEQIRLARLQSANLIEQNAFELSHLKWRRLSGRVHGIWQMLLLGAALGFAIAVAGLLWSAHVATGLVVEPLRTPPDMAARGIDGTLLAQQLLDRMNNLVEQSKTYSFRNTSTISGNWGDDAKVEIPQTGISFAELKTILRDWLGSETRIGGEVWRTRNGIAIAVHASGSSATVLKGSEDDLDKLLDQAAFALFEKTIPFRYGDYYIARDNAKAEAVFRRLAQQPDASISEQAWDFGELASIMAMNGQNRGALPIVDRALTLGPSNFTIYIARENANLGLGRAEATIADLKRQLPLNAVADASEDANRILRFNTEGWLRQMTGAFGDAVQLDIKQADAKTFNLGDTIWLQTASDYARTHDVGNAEATLAEHPEQTPKLGAEQILLQDFTLPAFAAVAFAKGDMAGAANTLMQTDRYAAAIRTEDDARHTLIWPWLAYAWAESGNIKDAKALIARTPHDCTLCLEMRGRVADRAGDARGAATWFDRAVKDAPSSPFAADGWGAMLLRHGRYEEAIARFKESHRVGPHFADPLEGWGEVLMLQNRSDLALAKFAEAARYAPNWGRLHLKWGEALLFAGKKDKAKKELALASRLYLSTADRSELARAQRL